MIMIHRNPTTPRTLKNIPDYVLPEDRDQLVSILEANQILLDAGVKVGNTKVYQASRKYIFTFYVIKSQLYLIRSEILAAIKKFPRDVPRKDGYYPSNARRQGKGAVMNIAAPIQNFLFTYYSNVS
jgi:hypothetical protein